MIKGRKKGQHLKEKTDLERNRNGPGCIMVQKPSFACEHRRMLLPVAPEQHPHLYPKVLRTTLEIEVLIFPLVEGSVSLASSRQLGHLGGGKYSLWPCKIKRRS